MSAPTPTDPSQTVANQTMVFGNIFRQNLATGGLGGGNGLGGAIRVANDESSGGVLISACQFSGDNATGGSGLFGGYGSGGAIKLGSVSGADITTAMTLDSDTFVNNSATGGNGTRPGQGGAGDGQPST